MDKLRRKSRLLQVKQDELIKYFVAGSTARSAAVLAGVNRNTATLYFHKLREEIAYRLEQETAELMCGEIELDESYFSGVRLKGFENSLKRHSTLREQGVVYNPYLSQLETLNIFDIHADYIDQFKAYLEEEGIITEDDLEEIIIPVIPNLGKQQLKTIRLKEGLDYKRNGEKPSLTLRDDIKRHKVTLDYYPRIQAQIAKNIQIKQEQALKSSGILTAEHIEFLDMDALYFDLQTFKNERAWFNLNISKAEIRNILLDSSRYEILIPKEQLTFDNFNKVHIWQNIACSLI